MLPEPRPALQQVADVVHGALDFAELEGLGLEPDAVLDFSVNGNPYGPSPAVREAVAGVPFERYPDGEALALRRALASHLGVVAERIMVGNGSMELLWLVALAFLRSGDAVLICQPTFGEYARVAQLMQAHVCTYKAQPHAAFGIDADTIMQRLQQDVPRVVFLCNPNNPTGVYVPIVGLEYVGFEAGVLHLIAEPLRGSTRVGIVFGLGAYGRNSEKLQDLIREASKLPPYVTLDVAHAAQMRPRIPQR